LFLSSHTFGKFGAAPKTKNNERLSSEGQLVGSIAPFYIPLLSEMIDREIQISFSKTSW